MAALLADQPVVMGAWAEAGLAAVMVEEALGSSVTHRIEP